MRPRRRRRASATRGSSWSRTISSLSAEWSTYAGTDSTSRSISVGGSLDYFVVDHVSVGIAAGVSSSYSRGIDAASGATVTSSNTDAELRAEARRGPPAGAYALGLSAVRARHRPQRRQRDLGTSENDSVADIVSVSLYVPLLVHPAPHFFVGFGPSVYGESLTP